MCVKKFECAYTISIPAALIVFTTVVMRYGQNQLDSNQRKWPPKIFSDVHSSFLSQDIMKVRKIYNFQR